jgi:hypothetical protein
MIKKSKYIPSRIRIMLFLSFGFLVFSGILNAQNRKKVEILHCDQLLYNERIIANAQRLIGNVNITVDGAIMWCDSLYSFSNNKVDAFGNVHIVRGDTLDMYADFIKYDGDTKLAKARKNVKLIDKTVILTTDSLDYNMNNDLAFYNYTGTVKDSTNVLNSVIGQYWVNENKAYFKTQVDGQTKDYRIKSDTLIYFTNTKRVLIEGPTRIFNETDTLYAEYGWYDSMNNYSKLTKKPHMWNAKQNVKADSIFYDKASGEGIAMGNARLQDIENSIIVTGNHVIYNDITKIAIAKDSAVLIQYDKKDSLYLHADYLKTMPDTVSTDMQDQIKQLSQEEFKERNYLDSIAKASATGQIMNNTTPPSTNKDSISTTNHIPEVSVDLAEKKDSLVIDEISTLKTDTVSADKKKDYRIVQAYNHVRFFRNDMQGKCDSLLYWSKDSTIQLYTAPVLWSEKSQISAKYIEIINRTKDPDQVHLKLDAFIISLEDDSLRFNQIKGRNMVGLIRKNELYKIDVSGNGQSNYYAKNEDGLIGLNKAEASDITIYMNKGKVKKIVLIDAPQGDLKPMKDIESVDKFLPGFLWQEEIRPKNKDDIFRRPDTTTTGTAPVKTEVPEKKAD